jgi:eukaryotic-like serine/threonine-protein kinase
VMDFGIARAIADAAATMTQTQSVVGTAQYLSPEQAQGQTVDARSDLYSTGCLLYELLTGRPPFVGESPVAVAYQHVREPAQPPSTYDPDIAPELDAIVMKALTKRVEDRYQSAAAMRADIERYLAGHAIQAPAVAPAAPAAVAAAAPTSYAASNGNHTAVGMAPVPEEEPRRRRWWLWGLIAVLLAFLIAYGVPKLIGDPAPEQRTVPEVVGLMQAAAERALEAETFVPEVTTQAHRRVAKGRVISQDPADGALADINSTVKIVVSAGPPTAEVPDVTDMSVADAERILKQHGFTAKREERKSDEPENEVVDQFPVGGQTVVEGRTVTLYLSDGRERIPDVVGMKRNAACKAITDRGFRCKVIEAPEPTTEPKGTVVSQFPGSEEADDNTEVQIRVVTYEKPKPTTTPTATTSPSPTTTPTDGGLLGLGRLSRR